LEIKVDFGPVLSPHRISETFGGLAISASVLFHNSRKNDPRIFVGDQALADGHVIPVRDFMTLYIYKEIFVDRCYDLTFDQSAPVIIDIGANSGLFALRIKQLYPSARISCYEPFPPNFAQLQNTIAINRLEAVTPLQKAVGARPGRAKLFIHKRNMGGHSFYVSETLNTDYVDVEVVDLPSILGELQQGVDLLKVDCEGAEFDILMGLTAADARKIRQIIVETTSGLYDVDQLKYPVFHVARSPDG
jgi:FkbM family methyltransferase